MYLVIHNFSSSGTGSLIDLAFISCKFNLHSCSTIPPLFTSDHYGFELSLNWKLTKLSTSHSRTSCEYDYADFETANELMEMVDWKSLMVYDIDVAWKTGRLDFCLSWTNVYQNPLSQQKG